MFDAIMIKDGLLQLIFFQNHDLYWSHCVIKDND